jgi:tellurite resistance protein TehA-like permease
MQQPLHIQIFTGIGAAVVVLGILWLILVLFYYIGPGIKARHMEKSAKLAEKNRKLEQ